MTKRFLTVIPFNLPWNWSTDYTNQTAFVLGKNNIVICYMWADFLSIKEYMMKRRFPYLLKRYSKKIYLFYPILFIPFRRFPWIVKANEALNLNLLKAFVKYMEVKHSYKNKVLWMFDPQTEPLIKYFKSDWKIIYDCVDYFGGAVKDSKLKEYVLRKEKELVLRSDIVFANSIVLRNHLKKIRPDINLVPQGFRADSFMSAKKLIAPQIKNPTRPLIGFVGAVNARIDYMLLYELATMHPDWDFAIWGPVLQMNEFTSADWKYYKKLKGLKNVIHGKSEKEIIPQIVSQFDVGMIPYNPNNEFNKFCYPMKVFEFFYLGKPVVSTEIEELKRFPDLVKIGKNPSEWSRIISNFLSEPWSKKNINKSKRLSLSNSWDNKVGIISNKLSAIF